MLEPFIQVEIVEVKEEKDRPAARALSEEASRIFRKTSSYFLLDERGRQMSSTEFAAFMQDRSQTDFVLGGPYGVSQEVKERAAGIISVSQMTLTHEMVRLFFMEQLYRAMTIIKGKGYHH